MSTKIIDAKTKDLAILANDAYTNKTNFERINNKDDLNAQNQDIIKYNDNPTTGFRAKAYKNNDTGEITIAYAGTASPSLENLPETAKDIWYSDIPMIIGYKPKQYDEAVNFFNAVKNENPDSKITLTGHSLGGMLAILVGLTDRQDQMLADGEISVDNYKKMDDEGRFAKVKGFETPSVFMSGMPNNLYYEFENLVSLFGYGWNPALGLTYSPKEGGLNAHDLGIEVYQNPGSFLTNHSGLQIGEVNMLNAPEDHGHSMDLMVVDIQNGVTAKSDQQENSRTSDETLLEILRVWMKDFTDHVYFKGRSDPLILDLKDNGVERAFLPNSKSYFNLNNYEKYAPRVEWIVSTSDDGFLCIDKNQNGRIDNGRELFTEGQMLSNGQLSKNGVDVLKDMDSNHDNVVDKNDEVFDNLLFWNDANNDGISQKDELHTMQEVGIESFELHDNWQNNIKGKLNNGKTFSGKDYLFVDNKADTVPLNENHTTLNFDNLGGVPYIPHIGFVDDLWTTSSRNSKLSSLFQQYHAAPYAEQDAILDNILYEWSGTADIADEKDRKAKTAFAFGSLDENTMKNTTRVRNQFALIKDMVRTMDFMESRLGEKVLTAYQKDITDNSSKTYDNVKQAIIDIAKESAHDANMAAEAFYSIIDKSWLVGNDSTNNSRRNDFFYFKNRNVFMGDDNFQNPKALNRTDIQNIYFDKTVNLADLEFRQVPSTYNLEVTNRKTGEMFKISDFGRFETDREMTFHLQDAVLDKAVLQSRYVCKPASPTDNSRLITESYSKTPQTIIGDERDNDILAAYNTTVIWGKGDGNDTVCVLAGGDKTKGVHIQLRGLNQYDIFFRREKDRLIDSIDDLYIVQKDSGEKLKLSNFFDTKSFTPPTDLIFEDGTKMDFSDLLSQKDSIPVVDKTALSANLSVYKNNDVIVDPVSLDIKSTPANIQENKINTTPPSLNKKPVYAQTCNPYNYFGHIDILSV